MSLKAGRVQKEWVNASVVPSYKGESDIYRSSNSKIVKILSVVGQVYKKVLIENIRSKTSNETYKSQGEVRRGNECVDKIFLVKIVSDIYLAKEKNIYWKFMERERMIELN